MADLRYPIGPFKPDPAVTPETRGQWIDAIAAAPQELRRAVAGLDEAQLETPYRDGGWTVRQVVHHVPDSHINAYVRVRLALTERQPAIKTYEESDWAKLPDARSGPVEVSLALLDALHARWVLLLRSLSPDQFARAARHPQAGEVTVDFLLQMYAWHGRHHTAHITALRDRHGW